MSIEELGRDTERKYRVSGAPDLGVEHTRQTLRPNRASVFSRDGVPYRVVVAGPRVLKAGGVSDSWDHETTFGTNWRSNEWGEIPDFVRALIDAATEAER